MSDAILVNLELKADGSRLASPAVGFATRPSAFISETDIADQTVPKRCQKDAKNWVVYRAGLWFTGLPD